MSTEKPIYTKKDLVKIRKALGKHGIEEVSTKLNMNTQAVRVILFEPSRYNERVFDTVAAVLEDIKQKRLAQKQRIKQAI